MPLTFKAGSGSGDFKSCPSGSHIAVCNLIADLGIQPGSGIYPDPKHQVFIRFEIAAERVEYEKDGKHFNLPVVIGQTFTASMHEKANLRKQLEGWRGRKFTDDEANTFDVSSILNKGCMLNVVENVKGDKVYSNIASIGQLPKGIPAPNLENEPLYFSQESLDTFDKLPEWLKEKINKQIYNKPQPSTYHYANPEINDDDIPF